MPKKKPSKSSTLFLELFKSSSFKQSKSLIIEKKLFDKFSQLVIELHN